MKIIASIALENIGFSADKLFDYAIPKEIEEKVKVGCLVAVPFGYRAKNNQGVVFEIKESSGSKNLKSISSVLSDPLPKELISLSEYIKEKTFCTYFEAAKGMFPPGVKNKVRAAYIFNLEFDINSVTKQPDREILEYLKAQGVFTSQEKIFSHLKIKEDPEILKRLLKQGAVIIMSEVVKDIGEKQITLFRLAPGIENEKLTAKQAAVVSLLSQTGAAGLKEISDYCLVTAAIPRAMAKRGILEDFTVPVSEQCHKEGIKTQINLNSEQLACFESIKDDIKRENYCVSLLYGVTGSGKTSVYLKAIDFALEMGKSCLVLVPEIGLTPQSMKIFSDRYGSGVALLHSALSIRDRTLEFKRINSGECKIVIGTRSAIFAPLENIGLIVIDEEQEHTYKSEMTPRYDAVSLAKFRASYNKCPLILASATPKIESFAMAKKGKYKLLTIKNRFTAAPLPRVEVVDMRYAPKVSGYNEMSQTLYEEIKKNLENNQQAILFINRRGFNTFAACNKCGKVVTCPNCSISMTYHSFTHSLKCHYCGYSIPFTTICPSCSQNSIRYAGYGTQKIETEISRLFPGARVIRIDADVTGAKQSHEKIFSAFANGEYPIMIGTQMVAKGLNFPSVTLVGVISVDSQLNNDDFRALEKTFSLLTQVVGRSGRGEAPGRAVIQTLNPENEIISLAAQQNYDKFFQTEIKIRQIMTYPPYCDICVLCFVGEDGIITKNCAKIAGEMLKDLVKNEYSCLKLIVLGPMPARIEKIQNKYRHRIIIKTADNKQFRDMIRKILTNEELNKKFKNVNIYADMNPDTIL